MTSTGERVFYSMILGIIATMPFYLLQYYYSGGYPHGVPEAIFRSMWVETTLFSFLSFSVYRTPFGTTTRKWIIPFLLKLTAMSILAIAWLAILIDQMPCFLGGRGC